MKYLIEADLIRSNGECTGCCFESIDFCPCEDCGLNNIFELIELEEVEE